VAVDWADVGGGSDANLLAHAGPPVLDGLGPVGGGLHSPDEYALIPSLDERAALAAALMRALGDPS
jgi:glutamate carboxypeptidase